MPEVGNIKYDITLNVDEILDTFLEIIADTQLYAKEDDLCACYGSGKRAEEKHPTFIIQGDQVYIQQTLIDKAIISSMYPHQVYLITSDGDLVDTKGAIPFEAHGPVEVNGKSVYISKWLIN